MGKSLKEEAAESPKKEVIKGKDLLSTGSTTLNLCCSGRRIGGIKKGTYVLLAGTSDSGKTWLARTILAEASINPEFDNYRLIYTDPERGSLMDIEHFFGRKLARRIEEQNCKTVEELYDAIDDDLDDKRPFIRVVDSLDSLQSLEDKEMFKKRKSARKKGRDEPGSYAMKKAKENSSNLRVIANRLDEKGSILVIIAQLRSNVGYGSQYEPHVMAGGLAPKYYCHLLLWTSQKGSIVTDHKGKKREQGIYMQVKVKKNRLKGRKRSTVIPIYHSFGIDDLGACVDYLVEEGHWKKKAGVGIIAKELEVQGSKETIVQHVEEEGLENQLRTIVGKVFNEIEAAIAVRRKSRYA